MNFGDFKILTGGWGFDSQLSLKEKGIMYMMSLGSFNDKSIYTSGKESAEDINKALDHLIELNYICIKGNKNIDIVYRRLICDDSDDLVLGIRRKDGHNYAFSDETKKDVIKALKFYLDNHTYKNMEIEE